MKERLYAALSKADQRLVGGGMVVLLLLIAFEGWHLGLRAPFAQYRQLHESRLSLEDALGSLRSHDSELTRLHGELQGLQDRIRRELRVPQADEQLTAFVMTELDRSAAASGAMLKGVKPGARRLIGAFDEISYDLTAEGPYLLLCDWLMTLERELGHSAAITDFSMKATDARQVAATLKVAFYRPAKAQAPAK